MHIAATGPQYSAIIARAVKDVESTHIQEVNTVTTTADTMKSSTEAARIAQDAARRYMEESVTIGRTFFTAWSAGAHAALRTAFDLQNTAIQASRTMLDATNQANRSWFEQAADSIHKGQDATARLVSAGIDMVESAMPRARG